MGFLLELVKTQFGSLNAMESCETMFIRSVLANVVSLRIFINIRMFLILRKLSVKHWQENAVTKGRDIDIYRNLKG